MRGDFTGAHMAWGVPVGPGTRPPEAIRPSEHSVPGIANGCVIDFSVVKHELCVLTKTSCEVRLQLDRLNRQVWTLKQQRVFNTVALFLMLCGSFHELAPFFVVVQRLPTASVREC